MRYKKAVLDTNVVVSALLFRGEISRVHALWKEKAFAIAASKEIMEEYIRVLAYPKFNLTEKEIEDIIREELLPYIEPVLAVEKLSNICEDPDDDKFLACLMASEADCLVSGDAHLLNLKKFNGRPIITASTFLKKFL